MCRAERLICLLERILTADDACGIDARYVLAPGKRASAIKKVGMHGTDTRYRSTITSKSDFRVNVRYTVRLKIAGQKDIVQKIKLIDARK